MTSIRILSKIREPVVPTSCDCELIKRRTRGTENTKSNQDMKKL